MATYFGIDFGTTNCAVHAITAIGDGIDDEFDIGETDRRPLPSFVAIHRETGEVVTGLDAKGSIAEIEELKTKVSQANQEVDERKKLNDAQVQYREDTQAALLQDIARALKPEYGDYAETINVPMNEMLGEIYREKLKQIFKILEQKGIKVGN